jgi:hypothetical protein
MTTEQDPLRSLIERWRRTVAEHVVWCEVFGPLCHEINKCADELEALLASPVVRREEQDQEAMTRRRTMGRSTDSRAASSDTGGS